MSRKRKTAKKGKRPLFTQVQLENIHAYFNTLRRIHGRLLAEGKDIRKLRLGLDDSPD